MRTSIFQAAVQLGLLFVTVFVHGCTRKPETPLFLGVHERQPYVLPANWKTNELAKIFAESKSLVVRQNICRQLAERADFPIAKLINMIYEVHLEKDRPLIHVVILRDDITGEQILSLTNNLDAKEAPPAKEEKEEILTPPFLI